MLDNASGQGKVRRLWFVSRCPVDVWGRKAQPTNYLLHYKAFNTVKHWASSAYNRLFDIQEVLDFIIWEQLLIFP